MLTLLFVWVSTLLRISDGYTIAKAASNIFETYPFNNDAAQYSRIYSKTSINEFIYNLVLERIYNEDIKDYSAMNSSYHYLNFYNYAMGVRITFNRAQLTDYIIDDELTDMKRKTDYNSNSYQRFSDIITEPFGSEKLEYEYNGGYKGKGGYVVYFPSNLTYDEVDQKYVKLVEDGLFDENFLSLDVEIMLYNGNYQAGVVLSYEFLIENAGRVVKQKWTNAFYMSRYSDKFIGYSTNLKNFLIFIDTLFGLCYVIYCWKVIVKIYKKIYEFIRIKYNSFRIIDILDACILWLIFVCIVYWGLIFASMPTIRLPVNDIDSFKNYILLADRTTSFSIVVSITTLPILIRWIYYMTKCFPAIGALIITIKTAIKNLMLIYISLFVVTLGFMYASDILFSCYIPSHRGLLQSIIYANYNFNEKTDLRDSSKRVPKQWLYSAFYLIFICCFSFILVKVFTSVLFTRWLYLRSEMHMESEVRLGITNQNSSKLRKVYLSMLFWRKYREDTKIFRIFESNYELEWEHEASFIIKIITNFKYNYNCIKEINKIKPKEDILKEEADMRKEILKRKHKYLRERRKMYTGDDFKSHKDNMIGMALCLFNLGLYILIASLQFKVNSSYYYSHTINSYLTSVYMTLADNFFNFKDIPTRRNLNLENRMTLEDDNISSLENFPFDSFIASKDMQHKNKSNSNLKNDLNHINVSSGSHEKRSLISKHESLDVQYRERRIDKSQN